MVGRLALASVTDSRLTCTAVPAAGRSSWPEPSSAGQQWLRTLSSRSQHDFLRARDAAPPWLRAFTRFKCKGDASKAARPLFYIIVAALLSTLQAFCGACLL